MPYIGNSPGTGTRNRFIFTATASQTTFSGADDNGKTLAYSDGDYVDVYLNGICLVPVDDYAATSKTSIVLTVGAAADDTLEVIAYDIATIADTVSKADGGTFDGAVSFGDTLTVTGGDVSFYEDTNTDVKFFWDASTERLGVGTDSPTTALEVKTSTSGVQPLLKLYQADNTPGNEWGIDFARTTDSAADDVVSSIYATRYGGDATGLTFDVTKSSGTTIEAARFDSDGNLLVGKTTTAQNTAGTLISAINGVRASVDGNTTMLLNRITSDGVIAIFRKDGTTVGQLSTYSDGIVFGNAYVSNYANLRYTNDQVFPSTITGTENDNAIDIGKANARFDDVYATNGTIQTSDQNEKQQIASLTDAEITAAKAISKLFKTFKWNDSVAEKGDAARTHAGVIAQDVEQAMTDAGLDAGDYAFFISTTWWETQTEVPAVEAVDEVLDEEGNVITEAVEAKEAYTRTDTYDTAEEAPEGATERNRKGIRYPQLLSFIGAATEQRLASIESRLDALEAN